MKRSHLLAAVMGIGLAALVAWYLQPERRLRRSWHRLIEVVEARHARALGGMLAPGYHDRWGYTRDPLIDDARIAFHQIQSLEIRVEKQMIEVTGPTATITAWLRVELRGSSEVQRAQASARALSAPYVFTWVRKSTFPWAWRLESFDQPEFDLGRFRRQMSGFD